MARTLKQISSSGFSILNIYNTSLAKIGSERVQLAELTGANEILTQCNLHFEPALSELTRMHAWNCCLVQHSPTMDLNPQFGFEYGTEINIQERIIEVTTTSSSTLHTKRKNRFMIGSIDSSGEKLVIETHDRISGSDDDTIKITALVAPSESVMDGQFFNALTTYLASKLAVPIAGDFNRQFELLTDLYENILPEARKVNMAEGILQNEVDFQTGLELPFKPFTYRNYERV